MKQLWQRRNLTWLGLLLAFALVVAACGDDDAGDTTTTGPSATTATTSAPATTTAAGETTTTVEEMVTTLSGLTVIDDLTFEISLVTADPEFPLRLAYAAYFPLPNAFFDMTPEEFEESPIGNGPFKMDGTWEHDVGITVTKNADYAGPDPAQIETLDFQIHATAETMYTEALAGNLDIMDSVPPTFLGTFKDDFPDQWGEANTTVINYLFFPSYLEEFTTDVRRALSLAVDQALINETIFEGFKQPAYSMIPTNFAGGRPGAGAVCANWDYDPVAAKQIWDGIADKPETLTFWFNSGGGHDEWTEAYVNMWNLNLGIDPSIVGFETLEFSEYLPLIDNQELTGLARLGWGMDYPSPFNFLDPLFATRNFPPVGSNSGFYSNPDFDQALVDGVAAFAASGQLADAVPFYQAAEETLCDDVGVIPNHWSITQYVWNEGVDNVFVDGFSDVGYMKVTADDGQVSTGIVEPEHLIPTTSNESEGIAVLRALFAPLINWDAETMEQYNVVAESVTSADGGATWTVELNPGWTFHNGEELTADNFVNAWNYGALGANGQQNNSFYSSIVGYDELNPEEG